MMEKVVVIFGGSGYIGRNILSQFLQKNLFDKYYVCDIKPLDLDVPKSISFLEIDVRNPIEFNPGIIDIESSWIFNLAAIHREPGHEYREYFDTNIPGANHVNEFAEKTGIKNILFTSSIAPYGKSMECRTENSPLYPETAYGISKALAENIHKNWLAAENTRRLIIIRPSVIFGPEDPGNVYRMIKAIKNGTFILPDGGNIVKAYGYIYGLVESIEFTMEKQDRLIVYNYAENPLLKLNEMVAIVKKELNYKKPVFHLSVSILSFIAYFLQIGFKLFGIKSEIHPVRVRKAGFPTNISPKYLIDNGFEFKYNFESALKHWKTVSPEDF